MTIMKPQNHLFKTVILLFTINIIIGCSKDDSPSSGNENGELVKGQGITVDDLDTYAGDLGLSFSTREIAKKGYKPTKAIITVDANTGNFNQTIAIDSDTYLAQLSIKAEDLSKEAQAQLQAGVPIDVDILDENDNSLASKSFSILSFKSNPDAQEVDNNTLNDVRNNLTFKEDIPYYIQIVKENQNESKLAAFVDYNVGGTFGVPVHLRDNYDFEDTNPLKNLHQFTFKRIPNDPEYFAIISGVTSGSKHLFLRIRDAYLFQDQTRFVEDTDLNTIPVDHRFKFVRDNNTNFYRISPKEKGALRKRIINGRTRLIATSNSDYEAAYFRILTVDIDWNIEVLDTKFLTPILPPPTSGFTETNTKLSNCTQGPLTQTFTLNESKTKTSQASFEESFSMTSRNTVGRSLTLGVSTEMGFFGTGVNVSAEATASYEQETSITSTNTQYVSDINSEERSFTASRTIEVIPGTAVYVYDATQIYREVKVPFIQRYRIKGTYQTGGTELTGDEIFTQFLFTNANGGVVTTIGSKYIELTVRGTNTIGDILHVESRADSTDPDCN